MIELLGATVDPEAYPVNGRGARVQIQRFTLRRAKQRPDQVASIAATL
jgi:hypothetical protein